MIIAPFSRVIVFFSERKRFHSPDVHSDRMSIVFASQVVMGSFGRNRFLTGDETIAICYFDIFSHIIALYIFKREF